ncbi:hypothetical protein LV83_00214 [Algoriphagus yeomjeoni]|uniref:Uncharacterized protein n=1 Tax=Algoriphagus yeomjeoni TaxID=291403 RepID=A0A327PRG3_9BACT|nr:hypothetical protein LV83_00214 [Algoriphagus yeomjeoni]
MLIEVDRPVIGDRNSHFTSVLHTTNQFQSLKRQSRIIRNKKIIGFNLGR